MSLYNLKFTKKSFKDFQKLKSEKLDNKARKLWTELKNNPRPISSEKLVGNLKGCYSLRINIKHRLIYEIFEDEKTVLIISLSGYYK